MKLALLLFLIPVTAGADDFTSSKVKTGGSYSPKKCTNGDVKECLRLAWYGETGARGFDETPQQRLEAAQGFHEQACKLAKRAPCPGAERIKKKLEKVAAMKTDRERVQFFCGDALDGVKLFDKPSSNPIIILRDCVETLTPDEFANGLSGVGNKISLEERITRVHKSAVDNICPILAPKPTECTAKPTTAKDRRAAAAVIIGAKLGGELTKRGDEVVGNLTAY